VVKRSQLIKIIKEELTQVLLEQQSDADVIDSQIRKRSMAVFRDLVDVGVPTEKAKEAALAANRAAYAAKDTSKIPGIMAKIQSDAHLAHIGVNNKIPGDRSSSSTKRNSLPTSAITKLDQSAEAGQDEKERAVQVLQIVSPETSKTSIHITGKGQTMKINGIKIPPKYVSYILKGGPLPK
tara:strand:+ start:145 stop:687 length:543 start_codon:yes stop_codon:yes gene_type:complete